VICFGRYQLDPGQGLTRGEREIRLTPKSLSVLLVLAERAGRVVTRGEFFRTAWAGTVVSDAALTSCIQELRHALGDQARRPRFIETVHRRGYRFVARTSPAPWRDIGLDGTMPSIRARSPIVGREAVLETLLGACAVAEQGTRQLVLVTGEPGVGKTTLVEELVRTVTRRGGVRVTWGQCVEHYGAGEAYQPLLEALTRLCRQPGGDEYVEALKRYAPTWLAQLPALLPPARHARLQRQVVGATRERMLRELNDAAEAMTARVPLVLWLDDLHWSDISTLDWIAAFARRPEPARVLLIATSRAAEAAAAEHPLAALADELRVKGLCRDIALGGLPEAAVVEYVRQAYPATPGSSDAAQRLARSIHQRTGGNPLFMVAVLGDLVGRGVLVERDGAWVTRGDVGASELGIPDDVRRMIERQIDRLSAAERILLEVASVAGEAFSAAAVAAGALVAIEDVEATLSPLARHHRIVRETTALEWPDGTVAAGFEFLHALYRDVLYQGLLPGRRAELHREIGEREATAYGERAPEIAAELAMHFELSGDSRRAMRYREHAARNARRRGAHVEARMHFEHALALLEREPAGRERTEREVGLRIGLGSVNMILGWAAPQVEKEYVRAHALCRELRETPRLFPALWGLWLFHVGRGRLGTAREISENLLALARQSGDEALLMQAHHAAWATAFERGELEATLDHASAGIRLCEAVPHFEMAETYGNHDAAACARWFSGRALALVGRTDEAARTSHEAIALSRELGHPFSLALSFVFAAAVDQTRRDAEATREHAAAAIALAREQDFRLVHAWASAFAGWASVQCGRGEEGAARIRDAIAETRATGCEQFLSELHGLLAEAHLGGQRVDAGLAAVDEALAIVERTGERYWEAELHRLRGELLLAAGTAVTLHEARTALGRALAVGRSQGARLLVLRVTRDVRRLRALLGDVVAREE
jgi:predicted ATPase